MKRIKILYISGSRSDYGLIRETLLELQKYPYFKIEIAATGMHLMPEFGKTINEIKKDNFKIHIINATYKSDNKESMLNFVGQFILKLAKKNKNIKPDIILIQGDRVEMLGGAIVGAYLTIPVFHTHGGEVTATVDGIVRHAITKLAHLHLAPTKKSAERIIKMGEEPWRVSFVGAPGLDVILKKKQFSKNQIAKKYKLDLTKPILLVIQHPVTEEIEDAPSQMRETLEALKELKYQTIIIYPSADPGGRKMIKVVEEYRKYPLFQIYKNIPRKDYLNLMKMAAAMISNSSSGIIEAPSFNLPVVNVGKRQRGRERGKNIIDVGYRKREIMGAVKKAIFNKKFREKLRRYKNPYGNGKAAKRIASIFGKIKIDKKLLQKQITY